MPNTVHKPNAKYAIYVKYQNRNAGSILPSNPTKVTRAKALSESAGRKDDAKAHDEASSGHSEWERRNGTNTS